MCAPREKTPLYSSRWLSVYVCQSPASSSPCFHPLGRIIMRAGRTLGAHNVHIARGSSRFSVSIYCAATRASLCKPRALLYVLYTHHTMCAHSLQFTVHPCGLPTRVRSRMASLANEARHGVPHHRYRRNHLRSRAYHLHLSPHHNSMTHHLRYYNIYGERLV